MSALERDLRFELDPVELVRSTGLEPDDWQAEVLRDDNKRLLLNCHRQSGKSDTLAKRQVHRSIYRAPWLTLFVSPTERQSHETLLKAKNFLNLIGEDVDVDVSKESELRIEFRNGSRMIALPGKEKTIRSFSGVNDLIVDEAARVEDRVYATVRPMIAVSRGNIALASTPFGKRGFFHGEWTSGGPTWKRVQRPAVATMFDEAAKAFKLVEETGGGLRSLCSRIEDSFLEEERGKYPLWWMLQEYGTVFAETEEQALGYDLVLAAMGGVDPLFLERPDIPSGSIIGGVEALNL